MTTCTSAALPVMLTRDNVTFKDIDEIFDDIVFDGERADSDEGNIVYDDYWAYVCKSHADEYAKLGALDDSPIDAICGVRGCMCAADYYLDIAIIQKSK